MPDLKKIVFRNPGEVKVFIETLKNLYKKSGIRLFFWYKTTGDCLDFEDWFKSSRFSRPDGAKDYPFCVVLDNKGCGFYEKWQFDQSDTSLVSALSATKQINEYAEWAKRGYTDDCKIVDEH